MAEQTKIEWRSVAGFSGNPKTLGVWGENGTRVKSKSFIANLRKWNKLGESLGKVQSVFPSICDPFEDRPELEPWRREMFAEIDRLPWVRLLLLTKRPENIRRMWPQYGPPKSNDISRLGKPLCRENCWLGTSVSNQATADKQIPELLKVRDLSPVLFVSAEPLLGPIDFLSSPPLPSEDAIAIGRGHPAEFDWIIVGGESGHGARPCDLAWIRSIRDQCQAAGVACFVKQLGAVANDGKWTLRGHDHPTEPIRLKLIDRKGGDMDEWPEDLRVRQFPEATKE